MPSPTKKPFWSHKTRTIPTPPQHWLASRWFISILTGTSVVVLGGAIWIWALGGVVTFLPGPMQGVATTTKSPRTATSSPTTPSTANSVYPPGITNPGTHQGRYALPSIINPVMHPGSVVLGPHNTIVVTAPEKTTAPAIPNAAIGTIAPAVPRINPATTGPGTVIEVAPPTSVQGSAASANVRNPVTTTAPAPAPPVTTAPAPAVTTAPAPAVTTAPAPAVTTAPAPATTSAPAPAITGSSAQTP